MTASKCGTYSFDFYLIPFRNCAIIKRRQFLWLHGDRRGGNFWPATFSGSLMPLQFNAYYFTAQLRTLDCLLVKSSNKERLDCKVTWHMTCIFQHSAVRTGLENTYRYSTRQSMHGGYEQHMKDIICKLSKRVYATHKTLRSKVKCMSRIRALQVSMHAAVRLGGTQLSCT